MSCVWPAPCSARAPSGFRPRVRRRSRSSAARASLPLDFDVRREPAIDPRRTGDRDRRRAEPQTRRRPSRPSARRSPRPRRSTTRRSTGTGRGPARRPAPAVQLTIHYHGWRTLLFRIVTFPLRFTPLRHRLRLRSQRRRRRLPRARCAWYRRSGRAGRHRDPQLPRRRARRDARREHPARRCPPGWRGSSSPTTPAAPEHLAALRAIEGIEVVAGEENARLRRERQPRPARGRPRPRRRRAQLRHGGPPRLARVPAVRGRPRARTSASSARGCSTPTGASSSPGRCATSGRRSGSTTATASSRRLGPGGAASAGARA